MTHPKGIRLFLLLIISFLFLDVTAQKLTLYDIKCGGFVNPVGIDSANIRFSWKMNSTLSNVMQSAYEIRVATDADALKANKKLIWSTGKISTDQSIYIQYKGKALESSKRYFWQVRVWDNQGNQTGWSDIQYWETGFLDDTDWKAKWIKSGLSNTGKPGPVVLFRKEFAANKKVKQARLYATAHGVYDVLVNGHRIGEEYFAPGWTSYKKRLQYQVYDISSFVKQGENGIGIRIGDGWYRGNLVTSRNFYGREEALLAQINIEYTDGSQQWIVTDDSWKASVDGPIRMSDFYNGEIYDARKEMRGWTSPAFDDDTWRKATIDTSFAYGHLVLSDAPPVRIKRVVKPIQLIVNEKGEKILDFGQNLVGWLRFTVQGNLGDSVILKHAEVLDKDGNFYTENLRIAKQQITYILKGGGKETYHPHFSFQGFRYVKIEGTEGLIDADNIEAVVLYSDMAMTGTFETSNSLLNQLQSNIQWGQRGNFLDVPTDCPQRNERYGWTGDAQVFFNTAAYNMDVSGFFTKWLKDLKADQFENGAVPHVIPYFWRGERGGAAGWADAATIVPWNFYTVYGDEQLLADQYPSMKSWIHYMNSNATNHLWNKGEHFGDWLFYAPKDDLHGEAAVTSKYLVAQAFYINSLQIGIRAATVLGLHEDIQKYTVWLEGAKKAFLNEYVTPSGRLMSDTQTAYVLALQFDVLPENKRTQAAEYLVENIRKYKNHLTTGFLGTPYLCHVLSRFGYEDVAYTLLMQEEFPSWLYPVKMGATTIWERWDGIRPDGSFQNPDMNSFNHYAYGAIGDWMYKNIVGIKRQENTVSYKKIWIAPRPGGKLSFAKGEFETVYGKVISGWSIKDHKMVIDVTIPPNTTGTVVLPNSNGKEITATNIAPLDKHGVHDQQVHLGSGTYRFEYDWSEVD